MVKFNVQDYRISDNLAKLDSKDSKIVNHAFGQLADFLTQNHCVALAIETLEAITLNTSENSDVYGYVCDLLNTIITEEYDAEDIETHKFFYTIEDDEIQIVNSPLLINIAKQLQAALTIFNDFTCCVHKTDKVVDAFLNFLKELQTKKACAGSWFNAYVNWKTGALCSVVLCILLALLYVYGLF